MYACHFSFADLWTVLISDSPLSFLQSFCPFCQSFLSSRVRLFILHFKGGPGSYVANFFFYSDFGNLFFVPLILMFPHLSRNQQDDFNDICCAFYRGGGTLKQRNVGGFFSSPKVLMIFFLENPCKNGEGKQKQKSRKTKIWILYPYCTRSVVNQRPCLGTNGTSDERFPFIHIFVLRSPQIPFFHIVTSPLPRTPLNHPYATPPLSPQSP